VPGDGIFLVARATSLPGLPKATGSDAFVRLVMKLEVAENQE
jgi:hypothetical protein